MLNSIALAPPDKPQPDPATIGTPPPATGCGSRFARPRCCYSYDSIVCDWVAKPLDYTATTWWEVNPWPTSLSMNLSSSTPAVQDVFLPEDGTATEPIYLYCEPLVTTITGTSRTDAVNQCAR
jgi:hypothetical protein